MRAPSGIKGTCGNLREVGSGARSLGAKGVAVLHLFPIFRQFFHFHENPKGDHADTAHTINVALARKATQYAPFVGDGHGQIEVMVLAMNSGGRMSDYFHKVLYAFAQRKVAKSLGVDDGDDANGAEEDQDARTKRKQRIARERKRMIAAVQAARIAYQARLIMATTSQRERQPGSTNTGPAGVN